MVYFSRRLFAKTVETLFARCFYVAVNAAEHLSVDIQLDCALCRQVSLLLLNLCLARFEAYNEADMCKVKKDIKNKGRAQRCLVELVLTDEIARFIKEILTFGTCVVTQHRDCCD